MSDVTRIRIGDGVPLEWAGLPWYVATIADKCDRAARQWLEDEGLHVFMLEGRKPVRIANRGAWVLRDYLVYDGYLFVSEIEKMIAVMRRQQKMRRACPVTGYLGSQGRPVRVNGASMQALFVAHEHREFVPDEIRCADADSLRIGDQVAVKVGPLAIVSGIIHALKDGKDVEILAQMFGGARVVPVLLDNVTRMAP